MIVLIPCFQPDGRLLDLVEALRAPDPTRRIVVVDDGSGPAYADVFSAARAAECDVIGYALNRGKGHALKQGVAYIADHYPGEDVVCADCDGQHTPVDIRRVAAVLSEHPNSIVLGSRQFVGDVPPRNRYGNVITRIVYDRVTGQRLQDTQTGLRGYPAWMLRWLLSIPGERYEYELEILLAARRDEIPVVEVPITTVYIDGNRSSHLRLPWDPIRIYIPFLKFSASSLFALALDVVLFFLFLHLTRNLVASVAGARLASASANYAVNGRLVFLGSAATTGRRTGVRYAGLASALLVANYVLLRTLTGLAFPLLAAKPVAEGTLFLASYRAQRRFVFGQPPSTTPAAAAPATRTKSIASLHG